MNTPGERSLGCRCQRTPVVADGRETGNSLASISDHTTRTTLMVGNGTHRPVNAASLAPLTTTDSKSPITGYASAYCVEITGDRHCPQIQIPGMDYWWGRIMDRLMKDYDKESEDDQKELSGEDPDDPRFSFAPGRQSDRRRRWHNDLQGYAPDGSLVRFAFQDVMPCRHTRLGLVCGPNHVLAARKKELLRPAPKKLTQEEYDNICWEASAQLDEAKLAARRFIETSLFCPQSKKNKAAHWGDDFNCPSKEAATAYSWTVQIAVWRGPPGGWVVGGLAEVGVFCAGPDTPLPTWAPEDPLPPETGGGTSSPPDTGGADAGGATGRGVPTPRGW